MPLMDPQPKLPLETQLRQTEVYFISRGQLRSEVGLLRKLSEL